MNHEIIGKGNESNSFKRKRSSTIPAPWNPSKEPKIDCILPEEVQDNFYPWNLPAEIWLMILSFLKNDIPTLVIFLRVRKDHWLRAWALELIPRAQLAYVHKTIYDLALGSLPLESITMEKPEIGDCPKLGKKFVNYMKTCRTDHDWIWIQNVLVDILETHVKFFRSAYSNRILFAGSVSLQSPLFPENHVFTRSKSLEGYYLRVDIDLKYVQPLDLHAFEVSIFQHETLGEEAHPIGQALKIFFQRLGFPSKLFKREYYYPGHGAWRLTDKTKNS